MSDYGSYMSNDGDEEEQSQASFFNDGDTSSGDTHWTIIDPNDNEAVAEVAEAYPKEELLNIFKSLGDELANMLYPGKGLSYRLALTYVTRMTNKTRVRRLAQLGYNFDTNQFP